MLKPPTSSVGLIIRKATALLVAYSFLAASLAPQAAAGQRLPSQSTTALLGSRAATELSGNKALDSALSNYRKVQSNNLSLASVNKALTHPAAKVPMAFLQGGSGGGTSSSIKSNFNGTAIPAGDTIWFTAVLKLNGTVPRSPVNIAVHKSTIQFVAGSTNYSLNVPGAVVTFSPAVTTSTATFDTTNNPQPVWLQNQLNPQPSGNTLLQAFAFAVPAGGLPGGIQNVTWTSTFTADTANISLNWQWAAAAYTGCVSSTYNSDDVKPTDDTSASIYKNSDHAGTPEACKSHVAQGATGGGGSNYTGSLSGTASVTPSAVSASPVITAAVSPTPNSNGWNNTNPTVSFTCSDANFAIATCPAPVTVSTEGAGQIITGTAVDQAGGGATAKASVTVNLDKTSPSITATATSSSGGGNVLTLPVTINFTCADSLSGVASCPAPIQVTTAGANQAFSGTATDKAGNTANTSIAINTEIAPLAVTASLSPAPNNGWNNTNVSISYQCTGGVAPVQCPPATTVSTEGAGQKILATATDSAGQSSTVTTTLNIDKTSPTISAAASPAPNPAGWNTGDVTITYTCSDSLSGVASCPPQRVVNTEGATQQFTAAASDNAGNTASAAVVLNIEKTAPAITASLTPAPNAAGWNNSSATVSFTCAPSVSPILSCPAAVSVTTEGKGQDVSGTVTDQAGKSNSASVIVNLDETPPSIGIATPVAGGYTNVALTPITVTYSDSGSGVDVTTFTLLIDGVDQTARFAISTTGATGSPAAALPDGLHTVTVSIKDLAGNPSTATATFTLDTTPPQITITQPANGTFTNAASLVVTGTVVDAAPVTVTVAGTAVPVQNGSFTSAGITLGTTTTQTIPVVATDAAGNSSTVTLTGNIDRTPPTITGAINPPPNAAGWNNTSVTVTFTCADAGSGIATCPAPVQLATEGANQAVTGTAVDKAGNVAQATVTVNIDKTPPVITGTAAPTPNPAGWNTTDVIVTYTCSDTLSGVLQCPPARTVSTEGKAQPITATVSDVAGNTATSTVVLNIEKTAPSITASIAPPPNAAGWNNTNVTASFLCTPSASDITSCQTPIAVTTEGKGQAVTGTVTDQAGKSNTTTATVNIDKTAPSISASTAPPPNAAGWNNTDVVISYLCSDSLSGIAICPPPVTVSTEGSAESFNAQATDQAGNTAGVTTTLNIDKTPPLVTATAAPAPNGAGWNNTNVTVTFSCTDSLSGVANCPAQQLVATEGQNQPISGQATDVAGNVGTGSISLSIDKTPPTIVQLSTPDHVSRLHSGQVSVTVNDNFFVSQVVITVNGTSLGTFTSAPYQAALQVPAAANPGDTLTVTAVATDEAGNTQTSSRSVRVAADGVIVGQVLSDATSFPIQGAVVQTISTTATSDQTDDHGRYTLLASDSHLFLSATSSAPPTTTVEREVFVQDGVGTVPVDARLTPLAAPVVIGSAGGTVTTGNITVTVPGGTVADGTTFQLTPLSGQGLPGLLPLGWTPFAAFDLRASSPVTNLSTAIFNIPNTVLHLVTYNPALHAWTMVAPGIPAQGGAAGVFLPSAGAYALVFPDLVIPPITIPDPGNPLPGIAMQLLDPAASSSGTLSPAILPPSGGTSTATLGVQTVSPVPSGTVIQANVSETFSLTSGDLVSEETRSEDIVIYNALAPPNSTLGAQFAVAPSHKYTNSQLLTGKVHLDILAGREGVRGQPGGSDPVTLTDGIATLFVPGGALSQDTAINVQGVSLENFIPTNGSIGALQEVLVDFSGETLNTLGQLSISSTGLNPAHTFFLTQVQRIDGIPHIVLVALAQISGANLTSVASPGLPGITQGGEYVFYDVSAPVGFVQGIVSSSAGPVQALVQTDSLPVVSITGANGQYIVPAIAGTANLKANSPHTNLTGSSSVQVAAGQTTQANILLAGTVTSAVVAPADGTLGVPVSTTITITTSAALNPQSISQANLVLLQGNASSGTPVPVGPFVLSNSGTVLSFAPVSNLNPATQYTIQVAGFADTFGGAVVVPVSSFTTKAAAALNFDPNAITFSFPDANGNIQVSAPAGSLPPGTKVLIIDQSSGLVLSLTALNDGSVSGNFPGTINDVLQLTVTDPTGASASFTRSQFVAADGSVAVGSGGGTVTGPGGVELRIPDGALDKAATFKIEAFGPDRFAERPTMPGGAFGGGLKITSTDQPTFKKEVKLAFPKPSDAPDGAFFQVYRRLTGPNGQVAFEDLDYAQVEGQGATAKVVTASFPYRGLIDFNALISQAAYQGQVLGGPLGGSAVVGAAENNAILMWTFDNALPGISLGGAVTGRVRYSVAPGGTLPDSTINKTGDNVFVGVPNVTVTVDVNTSTHALGTGVTVATTQPDGTFTFSDPTYRGGTINLVAADGSGNSATASAIEVVSLTDKTVNDFAGPLLKFYRNVAFADMVVPMPAPPVPTPQIGVFIFKEDPNADPPGVRAPVTGLIPAGTSLVIAFKTNQSIQKLSVTINGNSYATQPDQPKVQGDPNTLNFELSSPFVPSTPGVYTLTATGLTAFAQPVSSSISFMVIAPGGNNNTINVGVPPTIVSVTPVIGATEVPVDTFIQVVFSEPVTNVAGHVSLIPADGSTAPTLKLSGFSYLDVTNSNPISNLSATDAVSAITIQPLNGLKFNTKYTLQVTSDVVDLDNTVDKTKPALSLVQPQSPYYFSTFGPKIIGGTPPFGSTRPVVLGNRAYLALSSLHSQVKTFNILDPVSPVEIPTSTAFFVGRAMDIAGEENASVIGGDNLIAVAAGFASEDIQIPSNLWLYDVSNDQMNRVGAVSVTSSAVNVGQVMRVTLHGSFAYTTVIPGGIEVVDLQQAITDYNQVFNNANPIQFGQQVTTDGEGFANDAVVNSIPVQDSSGRTVFLMGIKAGDFVLPGSDPQSPVQQTFVVATGTAPGTTSPNPISFVVADPTLPGSSAVVYSGQVQLGTSVLTSGTALVLAQLTDSIPDANGNPVVKPVAIVVGLGTAPDPVTGQNLPYALAVIDMTVPASPVVMSIIGLPTFPSDVVVRNTTALVGTGLSQVLLINLIDPRHPLNAGVIGGSAFGDRLALTSDGILFSTSFDPNRGGLEAALMVPGADPCLVPVCTNGSCDYVKATLSVSLNPSGTLSLDPTPKMPNFTATVVSPELDTRVSAATFAWDVGFHFAACGGERNVDFKLPTVSTTGNIYTPTFTNFRGGTMTVTATLKRSGLSCSSNNTATTVKGLNPDLNTILNTITDPLLKKAVCVESKGHQFYDSSGMPVLNCEENNPNKKNIPDLMGVGLMQLTNPRASDEAFWSWKQNVAEAIIIINQKRQDAADYVAGIQKRFPTAPDLTDDQMVREVIQRYNGGHYYRWDPGSNSWIVSIPPMRTVDRKTGQVTTKPNTYVDQALNKCTF